MEKITVRDRAQFPELMRSLFGKENICAEIGVANGDYAFHWLKQKDTYREFYLVDPWTPERWFRTGVTNEGMEETYLNVLMTARQHSQGRATVIRSLSHPVSKRFQDGYFTFVYIDAAHDYTNVKNDLVAWYNKVRAGGVLAGHDIHMPEVRQAVDEMCLEYGRELIRVLRDTDPSWFIRKA